MKPQLSAGRTVTLFWQELKTTDFDGDALANRIAVLPVAAIEQHGPHLPLGTDAIIGKALSDRAAAALPANSPALFLPVMEIGKSTEHKSFAGTVSLSWTTTIKTLLDIGDSVARSGIHKLIFITSHGGNMSSMEIAGRELRNKHSMLVASTAWEKLGMERTDSTDIHGGDMETSIMLALRPDLVDMNKAEDFESSQSELARSNNHLGMHSSDASISWMAEDLNPAGVVGNAKAATAEKGEQHIKAAVEGFTRLIDEVAKAELST